MIRFIIRVVITAEDSYHIAGCVPSWFPSRLFFFFHTTSLMANIRLRLPRSPHRLPSRSPLEQQLLTLGTARPKSTNSRSAMRPRRSPKCHRH